MKVSDERSLRVLNCSTKHITSSDGELLNAISLGKSELKGHIDECYWPCMGVYQYGAWFYTASYCDEGIQWSDSLMDVLKIARESGFRHVRFDDDGFQFDDLPVFEW